PGHTVLREEGEAPEGAPEPEAVSPKRAAKLRAVVPSRAFGIEALSRTQHLIRAAFSDETERHTGSGQRQVGTSRRDLDVLEGIEIEVGRRLSVRRRDPDAVEDVVILVRVRSLPDEGGLRAAVFAPDVHVGEENRRRLPQDGPDVARRR